MKKIEIITKMCPDLEFFNYLNTKDNFYQAWNDCERGDWMLWIAYKLGVGFKLMVKANAMCALTVRHLMTDKRSINYCETSLLFADGKVTPKDLNEAAIAASAAYVNYDNRSAGADHASHAAYSPYPGNSAFHSAIAAAHAASDFNDKNARKRNQKETSDICREILTDEVFKIWDKKLLKIKN